MFAPNTAQAAETFEAWTKPTKEAFEFWVSFWPVAPLFGVAWRFGDVPFMGTGFPMSDKAMETAAEMRERTAEMAAEMVETAVELSAESAETAAKMMDAATEAVEEAVTEEMADSVEAALAEDVAEAPVEEPAEELAQGELAVGEPEAPADDALPPKPANLFDAAPESADDLKMIRGIGPGLERQLNGLGVYRFDQIAGFSESDLAWIDDNLTSFKGRCFRDDWVGQAKDLMG